MRIEQIEQLIEIVECGSIGKAAPGSAHNLCAACAQIPHLPGVLCFVRGRSVQKKCRRHFFSVGRSGYAARGNHVGRIAVRGETLRGFLTV